MQGSGVLPWVPRHPQILPQVLKLDSAMPLEVSMMLQLTGGAQRTIAPRSCDEHTILTIQKPSVSRQHLTVVRPRPIITKSSGRNCISWSPIHHGPSHIVGQGEQRGVLLPKLSTSYCSPFPSSSSPFSLSSALQTLSCLAISVPAFIVTITSPSY